MISRILAHINEAPVCYCCKRRILVKGEKDLFERPLHARCKKKANMCPEVLLLLRACMEKLKFKAEFTMEEIMQSAPVAFYKEGDMVFITSSFTEPDKETEDMTLGADFQEDDVI